MPPRKRVPDEVERYFDTERAAAWYMLSRTQAVALGRAVRPMLDEHQLGFLADLAVIAPDGDALEIGTYFGSSALTWGLMRRGRGTMHIIDPFTAKSKQRAVFDSAMAQVFLSPIVHAGLSQDGAIMDALPRTLAFAFIDGDHSEEAVVSDLYFIAPRIVPGGVLIFHDYAPNCPGVVKTVDSWRLMGGASWDFLGGVSSTRAYRRPVGDSRG
jgi:predicted O-methyltransferase YrrM